jgi:hypothetical protein
MTKRIDTDMGTMTLTGFLLARIAEDEVAARAVPPLGYNTDMGGNRQDERWIFDRTLPSSADGMGNWSKHRHSLTTAEHFARHDPARVLAECEAKRRIVDVASQYVEPDDTFDAGFKGGASHVGFNTLRALASVYADHPDYREEWRP